MDEDDIDFSGSARSRLSSLFQNESSSGDVNQALTFTAPKQPKKNDNAQGNQGTLKLIHAVIVHTYKLIDGNYVNQGKLGCAVLGHHETSTYKLLLYKGKQVQITIVAITPSFIFHVQPNNYANFYDQKKENWSINFDSEATLFDFTRQVVLAKANSQGQSLNSLVIQDLVKGDGQALENGDTAEIKYSGWLLSNFTFGQMFDNNMNSDSALRVRLGKVKSIKGWNDGLLGMQKGGRRLLIIPPDLAYSSEGMGNAIPPNSTLIFEVHVVRIKSGHESSHSPSPVKIAETAADKKPDVPPRQPSFSQEDNIKMRGASISEQLSQSPKRDKAQLISRMAKMGTATLPFHGAIAAQVSSDSESEGEPPQPSSPAPKDISRTSSPKAISKPRSRTNSGSSQTAQPQPQGAMPFHGNQSSSHMTLYAQSAMPSQQPFVCATPYPTFQQQMPGQFSIPPSPYSTPSVSGFIPPVTTSIADSHLSLLLTETRSQNTEVRMNLSKITDKVDMVIQKIDDVRLQERRTSTNLPLMENAIILQNIERIIQENTRLKEDNEAKICKIQSLNEIICDLFQRNPRLPEESSSMQEKKNELLQTAADDSQEKISNLEQEKSQLQLELSTVSSKLKKFESDVTKYQEFEITLNEKLEKAQTEVKTQLNLLSDTQEKMSENKTIISSLQDKLKAVEHEKELLSLKLQSIEEEHTKAEGSSELIEIYKKEIQEYKEKVEQLNSVISGCVSTAQLEEEKQKIRKELAEVMNLKNEKETEIKEMKKKIDSYEELKLSYEDKIRRLETEVENYQALKRKYEVFQEKTRALKETYEKHIVELMNEIKHLQSAKSNTSPEFAVEIKRVMNRLYKLLQGKFESDTSYSGSKVLETVLQTIMALTFQILESTNQSSEDHSNANETSQKAVLPKEVSKSAESKNEFSQQNGIGETEVVPVSMDPPSNPASSSKNLDIKPDDVNISSELLESKVEVKSESNINKEVNDINVKDELTAKIGEPIKSESPEIWRQPPPLFDDDDDDEEDDDVWG